MKSKQLIIDLDHAKKFIDNQSLASLIYLRNATTITGEAAAVLAGHDGDLELNGLTELPKDVAKHLGAAKCYNLYLNGLTELPKDVAKNLGAAKCCNLYLNGLTEVSEKAATELANYNGESLSLKGLTSITKEIAVILSKREKFSGRGPRFLVNQSLLASDDLRNLLMAISRFGEDASRFFSSDSEDARFGSFGGKAPDMLYFDQITSLDPELAGLLSPLRRRLSLRNVLEADLESLKNLMEEKVSGGSMSTKYYVFGCLELGLQTLDAPRAAILNRSNGQLSLPNLKQTDPKAAAKLRGIPWNLLLGIETIDTETAKALVDLPKKSMGRGLHFPNLKKCNTEALSVLATITSFSHGDAKASGQLILGFERIDDEQVRILASRNGGYDCASLPDLREGSVELFTIIGDSWDRDGAYKRSACFDSLEKISSEEAEALVSRIKATSFSLNGLKKLEPGVAEQLSKYKPVNHSRVLCLNGLESITAEDAAHLGNLSRVDYLSLDGLQSIDSAVASGLAGFSGILSLNGLKFICEDSARELARQGSLAIGAKSKNAYWLELNGLTELSDKAAEELSAYKGKCLKLNGLKELSASAAQSLAKYQGNMHLDGLSKLDDDAAEALSKHQGDLGLHGLRELSEVAADFLSKHQGSINT
jgi:hypothetical protein